jgi:putative transposase
MTKCLSKKIIRRDKMAKKYRVTLTDEERKCLQGMVQKGKIGARKINRAHILLLADEGESDVAIMEAVHTGESTVHRVRQGFVEEGFEAALHERRRPGKERILQGRQAAFLVALACTPPPTGRRRWTMKLLADRLVERQIVETISDETVRRTLKKTPSNLGSANSGVSPLWGPSLSGGWKMC